MPLPLVFNLQRFSIHDGPGIRTIVFLKGCPLRCLWCQNPESIGRGKDLMFNPKKCIGCGKCKEVCKEEAIDLEFEGRVRREKCTLCGKCVEKCYAEALRLIGKEMEVEGVLNEVEKDIPFYRNSGGGITLSGGEPLMHPDYSRDILRGCMEKGIHTCIETSGFAPWQSFLKVLDYTNLFLYDLKHMDTEEHEMATGSRNELILKNALRLSNEDVSYEFRMPLIPGYNDSRENIRQTADFLRKAGKDTIHILPYHRLGVSKYEQLGKEYKLQDLPVATSELLKRVGVEFADNGIRVEIGR